VHNSTGVSQWHRPGDPVPARTVVDDMDLYDGFEFAQINPLDSASVFAAPPSFDFDAAPVPVPAATAAPAPKRTSESAAGKKRASASTKSTSKRSSAKSTPLFSQPAAEPQDPSNTIDAMMDSLDVESGAVRVVTNDDELKLFNQMSCWQRHWRRFCGVLLAIVAITAVVVLVWQMNWSADPSISNPPQPAHNVLADLDAVTFDSVRDTLTWSIAPMAPLAPQASIVLSAAGLESLVFSAVRPISATSQVRPPSQRCQRAATRQLPM
jgi:hypothetical protein